ncbi:MAG TPA: hypothetical protein GXX49_07415 [Clostridiaceae bacterium]|nr:hypothetical protein [Clostridiaceae bacterium]
MVLLSEYSDYLIINEKGIVLDPGAPDEIKNEVTDIDNEYFKTYGQHLINGIAVPNPLE